MIKRQRIRKLAESLTDKEFYLSTYKDVAADGIDAFKHYDLYGWKEGRDPSADFCTLYYKDKHLSRDSAGINPLYHYCGLKKGERLKVATKPKNDYIEIQRAVIEPYFDLGYYLSRYNIGKYSDPLDHYLCIGWRSGNNPTPYFDGAAYIRKHIFIKQMDLCPFYHYVSTSSLFENKDANSSAYLDAPTIGARAFKATNTTERQKIIAKRFDKDFYLSVYEDVRMARKDALEHYLEFGWIEGRNPNEIFSAEFYRSAYMKDQEIHDDPFYHYLTIGEKRGFKPNPFGRDVWPTPKPPSFQDWAEIKPASDLDNAAVVVVVPVYKGFEETLAAIYNTLKNSQTTPFCLLVINDHGPDDKLNAYLSDLSGRGLFKYESNPQNVGFVRTVNRALEICAGKDVILLNSDAIPYNDWIDRLVQHAYRFPDIATVTPLSNNATIFSYPRMNYNNRIALEVGPEQIDAYARACNKNSWNEVPTGVGFCFYMTATAIKCVGNFDAETFGLGYGEENDYCMRALKAGYRNIQANDVFVYHSGGASFDNTYSKNMKSIEERLNAKHPNYPTLVYAHVAADPAQTARRRLDCYRFASFYNKKCAVFVSHSAGGGIETHILAQAQGMSSQGVPVIIFRSVKDHILTVDLIDRNDCALTATLVGKFDLIREPEFFTEFLCWLQPLFVHVHSFANLDWGCTQKIIRSIASTKLDYYYTLHDYAPVCHRNNLVTPRATFCGLPNTVVCRSCIKSDNEAKGVPDPVERRAVYASFLQGARLVFAPSEDIAKRMLGVFDLDNIQIRPHEERFVFRAKGKDYTSKPIMRVGAIGAIGPHKGSYVIHALAVDAQLRHLPISYEIVGYSNVPSLMSEAGVTETGKYNHDYEALELIASRELDIIILPSIWPETYCYALSLALAAGVMPAVFDIGAQAERLRKSGFGVIIDYKLINQPSELNNYLLTAGSQSLSNVITSYAHHRYNDYLADYYLYSMATSDGEVQSYGGGETV
ncbi:glycosyltransferase [Methylorubrum rhodesianum]|uniref:glycosyltransferase n=1 Tax=Methylorubrum rhodesianum TaxID=29427 RepID=UPI003D2D1EA2